MGELKWSLTRTRTSFHVQRKTKPLKSSQKPVKYGTVETLCHIRNVIKDTVTPSWLPSVPAKFGAASGGTLKADEWRTMATVFLPLALVTIWGERATPPADEHLAQQQRRALDHAMHLFSAVRLACFRTMTKTRRVAYRKHIIAYIDGLSTIHNGVALRPKTHMAIHIFDFLSLFGPTRSWWCFPFERLIGVLQRLPHNHRLGEH